ncbi:hypothetical protein LNQ03_19125 [Klebsiella pneumoniae subsp. pneumoniae]|nr:hypothetical protein [Klebsiella pneumoniae subsp. pneumoniae]
MQLKGAETESMNMQRRVALARAGLGDTADAQRIFNQIVPQARRRSRPRWRARWCCAMPRALPPRAGRRSRR